MKLLRRIGLATLCALTGLPAWAAIDLDREVTYLQGAKPDDTACAWEANMVSAVEARSNSAIAIADKASEHGVKLSVEVVKLTLTRTESKGKYFGLVRGNITQKGKLVATRDFQDSESFKTQQSACEALRKLGVSLGQEVSDWVVRTPIPNCGDKCPDLHPDEPIVIGAEVIALPGAINDTVREECAWLPGMVRRLAKAFNETDPTPRGKLEPRAIDIEKYPGRRLVLRAKEVHALGGGGYTGPKWMSMSGELYDGNARVGSFESHSKSGRGLTTCRSLDSLSDHTVDMIVNWLLSPSLDAQLQ